MEILKVKDLNFTYPQCSSPAVRDISFTAERGEFIALCGATGSGKSTLLRLLKRELVPLGDMSGSVMIYGKPVCDMDGRTSASSVGFVMQRPQQQIVTDKVWHELAFGLENLGTPPDEIARRTAEMASYFGIGSWYEKDVSELSGGQMQLLNLAAVLVMQPDILILDEPTAQLDPIAAADFISTLKKLNRELSLTMIVVEHRLEDIVPVCDRLMVMDKGSLIADGSPENVISSLKCRPDILLGMPAASRIFASLGAEGVCPLTVRQGRDLIQDRYSGDIRSLPEDAHGHGSDPALEFREVYFRYDRYSDDILTGTDLKIFTGEIFCILGGNGSGKTTALSAAAGLLRPYSGHIRVFGKKLKEYKNRSLYNNCLAMLPQDVQTVFLKNTVREELSECGADIDSFPYDMEGLLDKHPYDLSGGQQQIAALAKVLAAKPKLLLLDEPTKGLDAHSRREMTDILFRLREQGMTIVIVTHDVEFAASCGDRCAMFFRGKVVSAGTPRTFFPQNSFYTTAVSRMTRGIFDNAVTVEDAVRLCRANSGEEDAL